MLQTVTKQEVNEKEIELIKLHQANNLIIDYNQLPSFIKSRISSM